MRQPLDTVTTHEMMWRPSPPQRLGGSVRAAWPAAHFFAPTQTPNPNPTQHHASVNQHIAMALDPSLILKARGMDVDPWQRNLMISNDPRVLLNCSRQSGKSTVTSAIALHTALFTPNSLVLLLSPSQRQSGEIFRKVLDLYHALGRPLRAVYKTQLRLELANGARVLCLPGREGTIRSF